LRGINTFYTEFPSINSVELSDEGLSWAVAHGVVGCWSDLLFPCVCCCLPVTSSTIGPSLKK
jgi:hypothetical protein